MRKKNFIIVSLVMFLFASCNNMTNNMSRIRKGSTFDFIGRFFNNWENGRVTDDRYDSHNNFDDTML